MTEPTDEQQDGRDKAISTESTETSESVVDDNAEERTPDDNEAAKYRRKLRDAESKLAAQDERLQAMQRNEAQRLAAVKLADPQDLWRDGAQLTDVIDDAGQVDPAKLDGLIGTVLEAHKHWARTTSPAAAPASEVTASGKITAGETSKTWAQVLNPGVERE
jgi:hypothetical protein